MHHIKPAVRAQIGKKRLGKGFSPDELKEAGVDAGLARKLGIPVDRKRKSSHEENVECLKAHFEEATLTTAAAIKKKSKK